MIRGASRGKRVVRLKCGDPFVLGRGGEEALALAAAGIPFEVVPGLTTAVSGARPVGIPVTHRGLASGFAVVSGHAEAAYAPVLESHRAGIADRSSFSWAWPRGRAIARLLISRGWSAATPAAICLAAGTDRAHTWIGTLDALGTAPLRGRTPTPPAPS